jgi:methionyl-tRNA formyltransferase
MRVAFFGTPDVAVPALEAVLVSEHAVAVVVTQPDRARGRSREPSPSPVKEIALAHGIPLLQPETPKQDDLASALASYEPDVLAVVAYGHLLPIPVLNVAPAMNVHFSLLPAYRGAAPVQRALMDGVAETGVSVFLLEPTMDTGPIVAREAIPVGPDETSGEVFERLVPIGARLLVRSLDGLEAGTLTPQAQGSGPATPAPKIKSEDAVIDFSEPASVVHDLVRALNPRPGAATTFRGNRLLVWRTRTTEASGDPGTVLATDPMPLVACGGGAVELVEVQPAGKRAMAGDAFARGYRPVPAERLG